MSNFSEKMSNIFSSKRFMMVIGFVGLYLLSTGTSWAVFSFLAKGSQKESVSSGNLESARSKINLDLPKTEECPINGGMFTEAEKDIWSSKRPITAVIENHADSRPPSGVSKADIIYEVVAEGGITRFLGVFYCGIAAQETKIAPVRSARVYFIDYAAEYGDKPIFMHVGGANDYSGTGETARAARALELLESLGWRRAKGNDFDTTYDSGFPIFWRNYERLGHPVATEHTMVASLDAAYKEAERRGFTDKDPDGVLWDETFEKWPFIDEEEIKSDAVKISFGFWSNKPDYDVEWNFDAGRKQYLRKSGGKEHIDLDSKEQLSAKNVIVMFVREQGPVDKNKHLLYTTIGSGKVLVFTNGGVTEGTWKKESRTDRTKFFDTSGAEIGLARGMTWIEIVPAGKKVNY